MSYCPECRSVRLNVKRMPEMQVMVKPGDPRAASIVYKGVVLKRCAMHEGQLGKIGSIEDIKGCVDAQQDAANLILQKFQGVRDSVLGGRTDNPVAFVELLKSYFFTPSELEGLGW